jgi:hypothetical protein
MAGWIFGYFTAHADDAPASWPLNISLASIAFIQCPHIKLAIRPFRRMNRPVSVAMRRMATLFPVFVR